MQHQLSRQVPCRHRPDGPRKLAYACCTFRTIRVPSLQLPMHRDAIKAGGNRAWSWVVRNCDTKAMPLQRLKFEVFGKVQGVSFRAYTCKQANVFGVKGWCRNTDTGTVVGVLEGDEV